MLDKKYKESEKLFKNKDFKGALKIYEELKDTEYYPKIKDNYDRCLILAKYDNIHNYIKNGDEIFNKIINNEYLDYSKALGDVEKCLMSYNIAIELAELQRDYELKNTIISKINLAVKRVIDIILKDINETHNENAVKYRDVNKINILLSELNDLNKLFMEQLHSIADDKLKEYIGKVVNKQYILERTLIDRNIDELIMSCKIENGNYDVHKFNELFDKILNLKRKYIRHCDYTNKYMDKDTIEKDIDELINKLNKKEFEVLSKLNLMEFDYYLKFRDVFNRNDLIREYYLKSLIDTKNFGLIFKVMKEAYSKKDYSVSYRLSSLILDCMDSEIYWKNELNNEVVASDRNENIIIFGDKIGYIYCVNPCSKEYLWNFKLNEEISIIKIIDDKVFVGCKYGYLYVFDLKIGNIIGCFEGENTIIGIEKVGDLIYIGCRNRWIYALNYSLNKVFEKRFNKSLSSMGVVGNKLIVAEYFGKIYCLEGNKILWELYKRGITNITIINNKIAVSCVSEVYLLDDKGNAIKVFESRKDNNYNYKIKNHSKLDVYCGNYGMYIVEKVFGKHITETIYYYDYNKRTLEKLNIDGIKNIRCAKIIGNIFFVGCKYGYVSAIKKGKVIWNYKFDEDINNIAYCKAFRPIVKVGDTLDFPNITKIGIKSGNEVHYLNLSSVKDTYMKNIHSVYKYLVSSYHKDKTIERKEGDMGKLKYAKGLYHLGYYDDAKKYLESINTENLEDNLKYLRNNYLVLSAVIISKNNKSNILKDKNIINGFKELKYINNVRFSYLRSKISSSPNRSIDLKLSDNMSKPDLYKLADLGKKHFKDGNYKLALNYFRHICKIWKDGIADKGLLSTAVYGMISSYTKLGKYHFERKEYQTAKEYYKKALDYILKYKIRIDNNKFKSLKDKIKECEDADKFKLGTFAKEDRIIKKININECELYDVDGAPITIESKLGSGGEGTVYIVNNGMACKVFNEITENRVNKLKLMVGKINYNGICSPKQLVYDKDGTVVGYLMDRAEGKPLKLLLTGIPVLKRNFPNWKKMHVVKLCLTILDKIKYLHSKNIILGDINPQNILVKDENTVYFIDTDSYQIENYCCPVGTDAFTPPELIRKNFKSILRTFENEYFTVAVLMFMILMYGKHPYSKVGGGNLKN